MGLKKEKEERKPVNDNFSLGVNGCTTKFVKGKINCWKHKFVVQIEFWKPTKKWSYFVGNIVCGS